MKHAITCPQCNAPLTPHRFTASIVCSYCGNIVQLGDPTISAARFHEAFRVWNDPGAYQISSLVSIGESHWAIDTHLAHGSISDVYTGRRARWPTELVLLKILRDPRFTSQFDNEWNAIQTLQESDAPGAAVFTRLIPQPVIHGTSKKGSFADKHVNIYRWAGGFRHTFEDVLNTYPQGIPAQASIWIWRRILEVLSFIHASGMAHGAILPAHLLVQDNDHGVRLVGYSLAGRLGQKLQPTSPGDASFYPARKRFRSKLSRQLDLVMSARCVIAILGGDPATAALPDTVPAPLAEILQRSALSKYNDLASEDAWAIREELGEIAKTAFGPPAFIPIVMPS